MVKRSTRLAFLSSVLWCLAPSAHSQCVPDIPHAAMADIKHAVAPSGFSANLIMNPQPVNPMVFSDTVPGEPGFWGWTDYHVLYPIRMEFMLQSIWDIDNQAAFCPHVSLSVKVCELPGEPSYQRQEQRLTFDYIIYRPEFHHVIDGYRGTPPDDVGRYVDYKLSGMYEGGLTYCAGSWYLLPVVLDGKEYTYVRYYSVNCLQDLPGIVKFAMRTFPGIETPTTLNAFYKYGKVLQDAAGTNAGK